MIKSIVLSLLALQATAFAPAVQPKSSTSLAGDVSGISEAVRVATLAGTAATVFLFKDADDGTVSAAPAAAAAAPVWDGDISIPYDAPARLAYEQSDKSMEYADFKVKYEEETVAMIKAKQKQLTMA